MMKSERLAIFFILTLILIIASFSIIGSLTMLIIEKERDIGILRSLGADNTLIRKIFIFEGWLISIIGAFAGILLGFTVCWIQQKYRDSKASKRFSDRECLSGCDEDQGFFIVPVTVLVNWILGSMVSC